mmetsp:Transcript_10470/g.30727  ORF Transcript_10470/g.30727 Transcript_10470/m.30727 type:complete len:293 (+) Transcript_10470:145-1023(+)
MGGIAFQPPCPSYHPLEYQGQLLWVPREAGRPVHAGIPCLLLQRPRASRLLVYFHANAEDLGRVYGMVAQLGVELGIHVLAVEYPGYGICSGSASEETVLADAESVLRFLTHQLEVPLGSLLMMGRSLGGGPAIFLASRHPCAGLVTLSAFSSLRTVVGSFLGWGSWFPDVFDNEKRIRTVRCPTLVIHGLDDRIVEVGQARELARACGADVTPRPVVELSIRPGVDHNNFDMDDDVVAPVQSAFPELRRGTRLWLDVAAGWLRQRTQRLAPDVAERVPYTQDCKPPGVSAD